MANNTGFFLGGLGRGFLAGRQVNEQALAGERESEKLNILRGELQQKASLAGKKRAFDALSIAQDQLDKLTTGALLPGNQGQAFQATLRNLGPNLKAQIDSYKGTLGITGPAAGIPDPALLERTTRPQTIGPNASLIVDGKIGSQAPGAPAGAGDKESVFQQKFGVFKEAEFNRTGAVATPERILQFLSNESAKMGFSFFKDEDGLLKVQFGPGQGGGGAIPGGKTAGPGGKPATSSVRGRVPLKGKTAQEINLALETMETAVTDIDAALKLPAGSFGIEASMRRGVREASRVTGEAATAGLPETLARPLRAIGRLADGLIDLEIENGTLTQSEANRFAGGPLTSAKGFETRLVYMYAKSIQPEGKLLASTIQSAKDNVKLSGLISEKTVRENLQFIQGGIKERRRKLAKSIPSTGAPPAVTPPPVEGTAPPATQAPVFTLDDLKRLAQ